MQQIDTDALIRLHLLASQGASLPETLSPEEIKLLAEAVLRLVRPLIGIR